MSQVINAHKSFPSPLKYNSNDLALPSSNDDAQLLQLCSQFNALERMSRQLWELDDHNLWTGLLEKQDTLALKISAITPTTLSEYRAIARALIGWTSSMPEDEIDDFTGRDANLLKFLMRSLVQD